VFSAHVHTRLLPANHGVTTGVSGGGLALP
jgi:hypothetical protein